MSKANKVVEENTHLLSLKKVWVNFLLDGVEHGELLNSLSHAKHRRRSTKEKWYLECLMNMYPNHRISHVISNPKAYLHSLDIGYCTYTLDSIERSFWFYTHHYVYRVTVDDVRVLLSAIHQRDAKCFEVHKVYL